MVLILWGCPAQTKKAMLNNPRHLILEALPTQVLFVRIQGIFTAGSFSKTNAFLRARPNSDWQIENI